MLFSSSREYSTVPSTSAVQYSLSKGNLKSMQQLIPSLLSFQNISPWFSIKSLKQRFRNALWDVLQSHIGTVKFYTVEMQLFRERWQK